MIIGRPLTLVMGTLGVFLASVVLAMKLGAVFIPKLDEGSIAIQAVRLPSVSLETSVKSTIQIEKCLLKFPEVESVVCKTGRPEIANDPMTVNLTDIMVMFEPSHTWRFSTKEELVAAMDKALEEEVPANIYSFSQPIRVTCCRTGCWVKSDVGISLYGDDLKTLQDKARNCPCVKQGRGVGGRAGRTNRPGCRSFAGDRETQPDCPLWHQRS
jgi:cobalt-zinc-cadmium resistance protein CzcA